MTETRYFLAFVNLILLIPLLTIFGCTNSEYRNVKPPERLTIVNEAGEQLTGYEVYVNKKPVNMNILKDKGQYYLDVTYSDEVKDYLNSVGYLIREDGEVKIQLYDRRESFLKDTSKRRGDIIYIHLMDLDEQPLNNAH